MVISDVAADFSVIYISDNLTSEKCVHLFIHTVMHMHTHKQTHKNTHTQGFENFTSFQMLANECYVTNSGSINHG